MKQIIFLYTLLIISFQLNAQTAPIGKFSKELINEVKFSNPVFSKIDAVNNDSPYEIELLTSGEQDMNKRNILNGKVIYGKITNLNKKSVGLENVNITISQAASGDNESTVTNKFGEFSLVMNSDTTHKVYVNNIEFQTIKIISKNKTKL